MIGIDKKSLVATQKEFYKQLSDFLHFDDAGHSVIDDWISNAGTDVRLAQMYQFYKDKYKIISKIDSLKALRNINDEFNRVFREDIQIWKDAKTFIKNPTSPGILKKNTSFGKFQAKMKSLYDGFIAFGKEGFESVGEWLAYSLNIVCCPYCNRHYTFTILKNEDHTTIRPQFDHFLPKSLFPLTAVCFFNLVPACPECNKTKKEDILSIHPYEDSFDKRGISFSFDPSSPRKKPVIKISDEDNENVKILALSDLYQKHSDIATDLINKAEAYNESYYDTLVRQFPGMGMTQEEIESAVWGVSLSEKDMIKRPFSKFTRDILSQLGIKP